MVNYYSKSIRETFKNLNSSESGLDKEEVKKRIEQYGFNKLRRRRKISPLMIFLKQFRSILIYILIIAAIMAGYVGYQEFIHHGGNLFKHLTDSIVIVAIIIANAIFGFRQEYKAEKAIEALKKLVSLKAIVIRDGKEKKIDASELVPGDIIILNTGEKVPADARIIKHVNLQTQEAALTGESVPVKKTESLLHDGLAVADRINMIFSGTVITSGRGEAIVTGTGMNTEIGKIAKLIQETEEEKTPLQKRLGSLGKYLGIAVIIVAVIVFIGGILAGKSMTEMFLVSIALAVAAVPEGLPAVVTISLALGIQRMIKRNALIRRLPSVETLGSTTVICTDKTGTLTLNEMTVRKLFVNDSVISVTGRGYDTKGRFLFNNEEIDTKNIELLLRIGVLCNDAKLSEGELIGDPTEGALIVSAAKSGLDKNILNNKFERIGEIQFDSKRKRMSTYHVVNKKKTVYTKGAPDVLLELCGRIYVDGRIKRLNSRDKQKILKFNNEFAKSALRVLGFAYKEGELEEKNMIFVGLQGMIDPPRKEVREAIATCNTAGIKVVMVTGDHKITAQAIGKELGLNGEAIEGKDLGKIHNLSSKIENIAIFARVDPEHKVKILEALRDKGHVVAMTGDGVNDAPALKKADIGISMGITGTDVAKEASDMILTDDNFASIVNAIEEGRGIYDNIKKFVLFLLSSNLGEILTIFIGILLKWPLPLIALQILWINLVTDGLPALALGVDPVDPSIMGRKPRYPKENIINRARWTRIIYVGIIMMIGTLGVFWYYDFGANLIYAQTMAFCTLVMYQMFNVLNCRSEENSLFKIGIFSNKKLILAIIISILMQFAVVHTPLSSLFKTVGLGVIDWIIVFVVASSVLWIDEIVKLIKRFKNSKKIGDING